VYGQNFLDDPKLEKSLMLNHSSDFQIWPSWTSIKSKLLLKNLVPLKLHLLKSLAAKSTPKRKIILLLYPN